MAPLVPLPMMVISNSPINTAQVFHQENFPHALMRNSVYYVFPTLPTDYFVTGCLSAIKAWHQIPATQNYESHYRNIYDMIEY